MLSPTSSRSTTLHSGRRMDALQVHGYRFAEFSVEPSKRRLSGPDGAVIPLSGRAYEVLTYLLEHRDRVVSKDELIKTVWPHSIVEDNNLNQAISTVRRALGDSRDSPRFIVTVAGRGYQFIGDVVPLHEVAPEARDTAVAAPTHPMRDAIVGCFRLGLGITGIRSFGVRAKRARLAPGRAFRSRRRCCRGRRHRALVESIPAALAPSASRSPSCRSSRCFPMPAIRRWNWVSPSSLQIA